jgi:hypothetical protein
MLDLVLYADNPAGAFSASLNASRPTGGTEIHMAQLADGFAEAGVDVRGISDLPPGAEGGFFQRPPLRPEMPCHFADRYQPTTSKVLITAGLTRPPAWIEADRHVILWTHDPTPNLGLLEGQGLRWSEFVCVSEWQASRFPRGWRTRVVDPIVADWIYELPKLLSKPGKYVCVSAWWKGTRQTLEAWAQLRPPGATLHVGSPYSHPTDARAMVERTPGCRWLELATPRAVVEAMRDAEAVFRVVTAPETFGVTDVIAQILGCRIHAWAPNGPGGALEALREPHGYAPSLQEFAQGLASPETTASGGRLDLRARDIIPEWRAFLDV